MTLLEGGLCVAAHPPAWCDDNVTLRYVLQAGVSVRGLVQRSYFGCLQGGSTRQELRLVGFGREGAIVARLGQLAVPRRAPCDLSKECVTDQRTDRPTKQ